MSAEVIRALTTLGGVVLGFALSQVAEWVKYGRRTESRRRSIRALIALEAGSNCSSIRHFWNAILARRQRWVGDNGAFEFVALAQVASTVPFPPLDVSAWQANLAEVASAYSESELERLWELHRALHRLQSLHCFFCEASNERKDSYKSARAEGHVGLAAMTSSLGFSDSVTGPAEQFKSLAEKVITFDERSA